MEQQNENLTAVPADNAISFNLERKKPIILGILLMLFPLPPLSMFILVFSTMLNKGGSLEKNPNLLIVGLAMLIPLIFIIIGLALLVYRQTTLVTATQVLVNKRTLFGTKKTAYPLAAISRLRVRRFSAGRGGQIVALEMLQHGIHPVIELLDTTSSRVSNGQQLWDLAQKMSAQLNLPLEKKE